MNTSIALADEPAADDVVVTHDIRYREGTAERWKLDLARPAGTTDKLRPAILVIHGGGWLYGNKATFSRTKDPLPGNIRDFARLGYVSAAINYRLSNEAPFPAALHDCKNAVRFLRAHAKEYGIDPDRIGAWGNSAGGHLALLLGMVDADAGLEGDGPYPEQSSLVQSAVSDSGPVDLIQMHERKQVPEYIEKFLGGPPEGDRIADYKRASPFTYISPRTPPLLLIYGTNDQQVGVDSADQFVAALDRAGLKDVSYFRLAKIGHCPYSLKRVPTIPPIVNQFFARTLRLNESSAPGERGVSTP